MQKIACLVIRKYKYKGINIRFVESCIYALLRIRARKDISVKSHSDVTEFVKGIRKA